MSPTHDYVIANGTGSSVRSDINDALAAVVSQNSSSAAPATTYAYMIWVDTATNIVKMRNGANSAWIELFETDGEFGSKTFNGNITLNAQGDLRFADSDSSNWVAFQAPATVASNVTWTLPSADGTANQTLITNGSGTLSWATPSATVDKITEGNTEAEVVDTGSNGHFKVTTEGTERFRCDSSGRLLLGTSSASTATDSQYSRLQIVGHTGGTEVPGRMILRRNETSANISISESIGEIYFGDNQAGEYALIKCEADNTAGSNDYPGRLVFSVTADGASSPTERMRITQAGYLLHGCTSVPSNTVKGFSISPDLVSIDHHRSSSGNQTSNMTHIGFYNGNGIVGSITTNGSATAYGTSSDYRLKENVEPLQDSIVRFQQLKPSRFNFIADPSVVVDGFIAHEVQEVVPEAISGEKDAVDENGSPIYQSIDQSKLVPLLTAALQEAIGEIESLKARLTAAGI